MSLKNIIRKTIASLSAISIVFGNCSLCGIGLVQVIAENEIVPAIRAELLNEQYIQYKYEKAMEEVETVEEVVQEIAEGEKQDEQDVEEIKGVAIQSKLSVYPEYTQDTYLPIENVEIYFNLPEINGFLPEKATVVEASTKSTTGEDINTNINQNYDSNSGLLIISYNNTPDENGNIYSTYSENTKDEFEIIYIYPTEAYVGNEDEINIQSSVNVKMLFKTENASIMSEGIQSFELKEKDNKGNITTFGITQLENNIYKGFLYSNVDNGTNYDTEFNTVSTFAVLDSEIVDEITMELKDAEFILNDEEESKVSTNGNVVYKTTKINKTEFDRILGQDGILEVYDEETLISTVKYIELSENAEIVKKLAVIYSDEDTRILSDEEKNIVIEYKEDVTSLKIKISKPVTEGFIHLENKNVIKATEDYGLEIKDVKYLGIVGLVNEYPSNVKVGLIEPETKISIESSNKNFSTLQTNKTTLTIKLDDTNSSVKLFNNPVITIKLPEGITNGNLSSPEILNGNGLTIKKANVNDNIITIELEGIQTEYDLTNVSGGTSIVMDIENMDFVDTLAAHKDTIRLTCIQEDETIEKNCDVNIVSKSGLLVLSKLSGFDNKNTTLTSIDNELKIANVETNNDQREVVQTVDLVNNYDDKISNLEIVGRLGLKNNELNSTYDVELIKEIEVEDAKVYYSVNKDATYNDESWTEEFTSDAKAYKVEINNKELGSKDNFGIKIYLNIPANLYYNQESYIKTEVNYNYNGNNINDSSLIGILTEKNDLENNITDYSATVIGEEGIEKNVSVMITPIITDTQKCVHSRQRVTYKIRVINNGTQDLENLILEDIIPNNAIYTYVKEVEGVAANKNELVIDAETKNIKWNIEKLKAGDTAEFEVMLTMSDVEETQEVVNSIDLKYNEESIAKEESKLTLKPAIIETTLTTDSEKVVNPIYRVGNQVQYYIKVKNIYDKTLKNVKVKLSLPSTLTYIEGGMTKYDEFEGYLIDDIGNIDNNKFEYNITSLGKNKEKVICIKAKVNQLSEGYEKDITTIAHITVNDELYESNIKTIKTKQADYTINLASNIEEGTVLKKGNEVIYTIEVASVGGDSGSIIIKDTIPEQLKVKKVEEYINGELKQILPTADKNIELSKSMKQGQKITFKVITEVGLLEAEKIENIEVSNTATVSFEGREKSSNEIKIYIQPELKKVEEDKGYNPEDIMPDDNIDKEEKPSIDKPTEDDKNDENEQPEIFTVSGVAWLDLDKNGRKTEGETLLQNIKVSLINMTTGDYQKDSNGNNITTLTDGQGKYSFNNLSSGLYEVMFEYEIEKYTVTTYKKEGINEKENSDAILSTVKINGSDKAVALTDKFELNQNKENIDLGLIENPKFDLSLNKQITEITVVDKQGTETYDYKDGHTAKVDLVAKYMNGANVIVNYKFTVKNEGEVTGYVDSLMDSLPSGLEFSSELNKNWYKDTDGNLYTTSLSGKTLNPGESVDVDLVLTKTMTEENAGTFVNSAKLEKISNLENIKEKEEALENNESSAILLISIKTGTAILYIGITMICLAIMAIGTYFIKKKVLMRII